MSKLWFTSDQHFGHKNIIKLSNRPFPSVEEMDKTLIQNWNSVVQDDDQIFVLGDFTYKSSHSLSYYATQLKGIKHLIIGNHDKYSIDQYKESFETVQDILYMTYNDQELVLFHYPILSWKKRGRGSWHLYGHVHEAPIPILDNFKAYNVGVDTNNFAPINYENLKLIMDVRHAKQTDK